MEDPLFAQMAREFDKIQEEMEEDINSEEILYHYTNYEGLEGIRGSRKLRYTDYRYLNDPTEIEYGINITKKILLEKQEIFLFHSRVSHVFNTFTNLWKLYLASFSTEHEKLALWRYYANAGTGFAIGFNQKFHGAKNSEKLEEKNENLFLVKTKVRYGEKDIQESINKFYPIFLEYYQKVPSEELQWKLLLRVINELISLLPTFKKKSFKDEHEVRIFCVESPLQDFYFDDKDREFIPIPLKENLPFVHQKTGNKPVILHEFSHAAVSEIWVGPCCEFLEARAAIRKLLHENGFDLEEIKIQKAELPYQHI